MDRDREYNPSGQHFCPKTQAHVTALSTVACQRRARLAKVDRPGPRPPDSRVISTGAPQTGADCGRLPPGPRRVSRSCASRYRARAPQIRARTRTDRAPTHTDRARLPPERATEHQERDQPTPGRGRPEPCPATAGSLCAPPPPGHAQGRAAASVPAQAARGHPRSAPQSPPSAHRGHPSARRRPGERAPWSLAAAPSPQVAYPSPTGRARPSRDPTPATVPFVTAGTARARPRSGCARPPRACARPAPGPVTPYSLEARPSPEPIRSPPDACRPPLFPARLAGPCVPREGAARAPIQTAHAPTQTAHAPIQTAHAST